MIFDKLHDDPGRHDPQKEHRREINAIRNLCGTLCDVRERAPDIAESTSNSKTHDLQPCGSLRSGQRALQIKLLGLFAAQFSAGRFWNAADGQEFHAVWRK